MSKAYQFASFLFLLLLFPAAFSFAQGERQMIKFSGIVSQGDSAYGVFGAHVVVPKVGRGVATNQLGYFSMFAREGDSVVISAVGFADYHLVIPKRGEPTYSVHIRMETEAMVLKEVEIFPFKTEELFKEAFLALEVPEAKQYENMNKNLNNNVLTQMSMSLPMSASSNFRHFMDTRVMANANRHFAPTMPFLDPFAWYRIIKSFKNGDHKKKAHQKQEDDRVRESLFDDK